MLAQSVPLRLEYSPIVLVLADLCIKIAKHVVREAAPPLASGEILQIGCRLALEYAQLLASGFELRIPAAQFCRQCRDRLACRAEFFHEGIGTRASRYEFGLELGADLGTLLERRNDLCMLA